MFFFLLGNTKRYLKQDSKFILVLPKKERTFDFKHFLFSVTHLKEYRRIRRSCGGLRDTPSSMTTSGEFRPPLTSFFFLIASSAVQWKRMVVYISVEVRTNGRVDFTICNCIYLSCTKTYTNHNLSSFKVMRHCASFFDFLSNKTNNIRYLILFLNVTVQIFVVWGNFYVSFDQRKFLGFFSNMHKTCSMHYRNIKTI